MRHLNGLIVVTAALWVLAAGPQGHAAVVAPAAYANAEAPADFNGPLGSFSGALSAQFDYAASELTGIAAGTSITSIGFRLDTTASTVNSALNFSEYSIQLGSSLNPIGSLSSTFASNEGADTVLARSGSLTISAGSLVGGGSPNAFYVIQFTTPYTYQGGDLLLTLFNAEGTVQPVDLDAVQVGGATDSVVAFSQDATTGTGEYFDVPVVQFGTSADLPPVTTVPEPASWALMGAGIALLAAAAIHRRSAASLG